MIVCFSVMSDILISVSFFLKVAVVFNFSDKALITFYFWQDIRALHVFNAYLVTLIYYHLVSSASGLFDFACSCLRLMRSTFLDLGKVRLDMILAFYRCRYSIQKCMNHTCTCHYLKPLHNSTVISFKGWLLKCFVSCFAYLANMNTFCGLVKGFTALTFFSFLWYWLSSKAFMT